MPNTEVTSEGALSKLRRVEIGSSKVRVPATPTIRYMFWMRDFLARFEKGELTDDDVFDCYEQLIAFLRRYNPDLDEDKLQDECELADVIGFYGRCFGAQDDGGDEGDEVPPSSARGSSRGSTRSRSRSRS